MTPEQQRIAIAEFCGWIGIIAQPYLQGYRPNHVGIKSLVPDYLNDLNAIHEAEEHLKRTNLGKWTLLDSHMQGKWHATAAQRAEALLKTIGKWVD